MKWPRRFRRRLRWLLWAWQQPLAPEGSETLVVGVTYSLALAEDPKMLSFVAGLEAKSRAVNAILDRYPLRPEPFPTERVN